MGVFYVIDRGYSFCPSKGTEPQNKLLSVQGTCMEMCRTLEVLITASFKRFSEEVKVDMLSTGTGKFELLIKLLDKEVEN